MHQVVNYNVCKLLRKIMHKVQIIVAQSVKVSMNQNYSDTRM